MTPEYRARRDAKHAAQAAAKVLPEMFPVDFTIDLTPKTPHLAFLNGKTFKQGNGGRKNASGHRTEQIAANDDNKNPYLGADGKWFWMDDEGVPNDQSYVTREQAEIALADYGKDASAVAWKLTKPMIKNSQPMIHGKDLL